MKVLWTKIASEDYQYWLKTDKNMIEKIQSLINDIERTPFSGIGKPEALKFQLQGLWSRRINSEHRLVYKFEAGTLTIIQCRYHY